MPTPLKSILECLDIVANPEITGPIVCPHCGERYRTSKYGFYSRYLFSSCESIRIQRYLCKNAWCPRKTFSILPYPFLRFMRVGLCFLYGLREAREKNSIRALSKSSGFARSTLRRLLEKAERVSNWVESELKARSWDGLPWIQAASLWTRFVQMFSQHFYPRYG